MNPLKTPYQQFIFTRTYSRYLHEEKRRETWEEATQRYVDFMTEVLEERTKELPVENFFEFNQAIADVKELACVPSMRALWTAGEALKRDNIAGYNCAYTSVDQVRSFAEILHVLLNGTGMGFSVEEDEIGLLPPVPKRVGEVEDIVLVVGDSKEGWSQALLDYMTYLWDGIIPTVDYSQIRPAGSMLKTFGGRASGPEPLKQLFEWCAKTFKGAVGRKLNSIEVYDIVCKIAQSVVVGGVRRSALMCLTDLDDDRMRHAKDNGFWEENDQRFNSNNSTAYNEKPSREVFDIEWKAMVDGGCGERGIFNRGGMLKEQLERGRPNVRYGVNPCGEIILRPRQFCNLSEVIVREGDTLDELRRKVRSATIWGCLQSTLTNFQFLSDEWKKACEEDRLLGVSLTGTCDHEVLQGGFGMDEWLKELRIEANKTAEKWAGILGINVPKNVTCVKPSGTVSQLADTASGIHPRYGRFYQRRVQISKADPLADLLLDAGVGHDEINASTLAFRFCCESPKNSIFRNDRGAITQLEYWKSYKEHWCDHNPSVTIYVEAQEWDEVADWVYENWDFVGGLSFFPKIEVVMPLLPYEDLEEPFENAPIPFERLPEFEKVDATEGSRELGCSGGACSF